MFSFSSSSPTTTNPSTSFGSFVTPSSSSSFSSSSAPASSSGLFGSFSQSNNNPSSSFSNTTPISNNTNIFGGNSSSAFGSTPSTSLFGSSTTGNNLNNNNNSFGFGTQLQQPQQSTGFGFSSQPASTSSTGSFGFGSTQTQNTGFGSTGFSLGQAPSNTTSTSLFGGSQSNPNTFGSSTQSSSLGLFGNQQATPVQDPNSLDSRLSNFKNAYNPDHPSCRFQTIFYNKVDPATIGQYVKPPNANQRLWDAAVKNNPDTQHLVPSLAVGFDDLKKRIQEQDKASKAFISALESMSVSLNSMLHLHKSTSSAQVSNLQHNHAKQTHQLLKIINKIEMTRSRGIPLVNEEIQYKQKLESIQKKLVKPVHLPSRVSELCDSVNVLVGGDNRDNNQNELVVLDEETEKKLLELLNSQKKALEHMISILKTEQVHANTMIQAQSDSDPH